MLSPWWSSDLGSESERGGDPQHGLTYVTAQASAAPTHGALIPLPAILHQAEAGTRSLSKHDTPNAAANSGESGTP